MTIEAYSVVTTLVLRDLLTAPMLKIGQEIMKIDALVVSLNKNLKALSLDAGGMSALSRATGGLGRNMAVANTEAAILGRNLAALKTAGNIPLLAGGRGGGGFRDAGTHGFHGGRLHMGAHGVGLSSVGLGINGAVLGGLLGVGAAAYGGHALYESAKDLQRQQARFQMFGLDGATNANAFGFVKGMNIYGTSQIDNQTRFNEAQGVFRESGLSGAEALAGAKLAAPMLAKIGFASGALDAESQAKMHTSSLAMLRFIEMSGGLNSPARFNELANAGFRAIQSSGGNVDWEQLRQFKARAGASGQHLTDDALFGALEPVIGELKGSTAGFALRTAFNRLNGIIRLPNQAAHELIDAGVWDRSKVEFNKLGGINKFHGNPFTQSDLFAQDPVAFYEKFMLPFYAKKGMTPEQRTRDNAMIFGATGGNMFTLIDRQLAVIHRSVDAFHKALTVDKAVALNKDTLSGKELEFAAAWKDFKTQWGTNMLPAFTWILKDGAAILRWLGANSGVAGHPGARAALELSHSSTGTLNHYDNSDVDKYRKPRPDAGAHGHDIYLDKRKVGEAVTDHQVKEGSKPMSSTGRYDPTRQLVPVAAN